MSFQARGSIFKNKIFLGASALIIIGIIVALVVTSGSDSNKPSKKTATTTTTAKPKKIILAPLTGLPDPTGDSLKRPALAVKIGNNPEARPQAGITEADIVYEEIVEGGITRYMAIFNSTVPERVGPTRSVRAMDPDITLNWGGIFAFSGGAKHNEDSIFATKGILALNETRAGNGMKRDSSRNSPNNLYTIPANMYTKGGTPVPPNAQFTYSKTVPANGEDGLGFRVEFKSGFAATWTYDQAQGKFLRSYGTKAVVDQKGKQVAMDNVVVQFIQYVPVPQNYKETRGVTVGSGNVWVFRNGKLIKGTWSRPTKDKPATYKDAEGKIIALTPGQTWVELASTSTGVTMAP